MDHSDGVCAALPVTIVSVSLMACHAHQAVVVRAHAYTQNGQDPSVWWEPATIELGPFDGAAEIDAAWTAVAGRAGARLPDVLRRLLS